MARAVHPHIITDDSALGGNVIDRSLRFVDARLTFLTRTPSSTGNRRTWTFSVWMKHSLISSGRANTFFCSGTNNPDTIIKIDNDRFEISRYGGSYQTRVTSKALLRDPNSWYHFVGAVDTTQATSSNRVKLYINGDLVTEFDNSSYPSQNYEYPEMNNSGTPNYIGRHGHPTTQNFDGYMAEFNFVDGAQLTPDNFGYTDPLTGIWRPKKVTGITYGTNGFYLDFSDNSGATATTIGKDRSGNDNNYAPTNISVSAGNNNDSAIDSPIDNFVTLNPLRTQNDNCILSNGNLKATGSNESYPGATGNVALSSGKWYYDFEINNKAGSGHPLCGICQNDYIGGGPDRICYTAGGGYISAAPTEPQDPDSFAVGDIIGVAIDLDDAAGNIRFYKNGTLQPVLDILNAVKAHLSISTLGGLLPYIQMYHNDVCTINFGQTPFIHTPPTGFRALSVKNLTTTTGSSIADPREHFDTLIWDGTNNASRDITGLQFKPD